MATFELGRESVSRANGEALHAQIADAIRLRISAGEWPPGHRLPPEPALAQEIGVSRGTLRRGLAALTAEGLLTQVQGRGTFVAVPPAMAAASQRLSTLAEDVIGQGGELSTEVLDAGYVASPEDVARSLRLSEGEQVFRLVRVRRTSDGPIALLHNYVVPALAPGIELIDFREKTLFGVLEGDYRLPIDNARRRFSAVAADSRTARALGLERGAALQYLEQLTFLTDGRPVEYSDVWIDSRRLRVVVHLSRHERTTP